MATGTHAGSTWNTTAGNKTVVATPASGDLIVVIHGMSGFAGADDSTITDNNSDGNGTYTKIGASPLSTGGGTAGALWISIRDSLIGSATSTTFTATNSGDTGGGLTVMRFSGMSRVGSSAARQNVGQSSQTENPPVIAFSGVTLTANAIMLGVFGEDNPAGVTPPGGFSEAVDTGWATPTSGVEVCWDDSGNTASSYAWSGGALTDHNEVGVELDTSAVTSVGTLDITLGTFTSSATGVVSVVGTATITLGTFTSTAAGVVLVAGAATNELGAATLSATGTVANPASIGTLDVTLGANTASATGVVAVVGVASVTLGTFTTAATGAVSVVGAATNTLGAATLTGAGTVSSAEATGTLNATLGASTLSATAVVPIIGTASNFIGAYTLTATAHETVGPDPHVVGHLSATLGDFTMMASNLALPWNIAPGDPNQLPTYTIGPAGN